MLKLALKNIRKSFKDYAIYFFTLILGVAIFYVFNAIESQTVLLNTTSSTQELIKLMINMLSGVSVFVSFILGFLIIYASRFLIKRRNKEFGIYLTLGMSKKKISMRLFFETLAIGIISLILGLGLGAIISQFMSLLVANMFEADMTNYAFVFSFSACGKTLIYFSIMYLLVMIFNTVNISRCKLIELLNSNKLSEEVKMKNPVVSTIVFVLAVIVLARAYYMVTSGFLELDTADKIFIPISMGSISTFLIFWSLSGLILKIVMSLKKFYYKGLNCFTLRQFSSMVNTMIFSMSIICLMLFVTICVLASSLSIKNSLSKNLDELAPADLELSKRIDYDSDSAPSYSVEQLENFNLGVRDTLYKMDVKIEDMFEEYIEIDMYKVPGITLSVGLGTKIEDIMKQYKFLSYDSPEQFIKLSDYNLVAELYGKEKFTLNDDEYIVIADFESLVAIRNEVLELGEAISIEGRNLYPKYSSCQDGFVDLSSNHINGGIFIVADELLKEEYKSENYVIGNYKKGMSNEDKRTLEESLDELKKDSKAMAYRFPSINSKLAIADASIGLGAMVTFIGLYLGIVFLMASAAILALKELSESTDNRNRYRMLEKIGADDHMINRALFNQVFIFFMTPLALALIHSIFGMKFSMLILESIGTRGLVTSVIMTVAFLLVIYGGYFVLTYYSSKRIIRNRH